MDHIIVPQLAGFETDWHFSHVVRERGLLFLSGITGTDQSGALPSDPAEQFEQAFHYLELFLGEANASVDDILEMTTYHVGLRQHLAAFVEAKDRHIAPPYPAWSAIGVAELITEGALVEIRVLARDPR